MKVFEWYTPIPSKIPLLQFFFSNEKMSNINNLNLFFFSNNNLHNTYTVLKHTNCKNYVCIEINTMMIVQYVIAYSYYKLCCPDFTITILFTCNVYTHSICSHCSMKWSEVYILKWGAMKFKLFTGMGWNGVHIVQWVICSSHCSVEWSGVHFVQWDVLEFTLFSGVVWSLRYCVDDRVKVWSEDKWCSMYMISGPVECEGLG